MKPGAVWIDHSTTDYGQNKFFTEQAAKKEAHVLECPITGGLHALQKGQMAVWVAGEKNIFESVKPVLDASYSTVLYTGGVGSAMIPKVVSNMLCFLQVVAMGEVLMVGKLSMFFEIYNLKKSEISSFIFLRLKAYYFNQYSQKVRNGIRRILALYKSISRK